MGEGSKGRRAEPKRLGFSEIRGQNKGGLKRSRRQGPMGPACRETESLKGAGPQLRTGLVLGVLILGDKLRALAAHSGPKVSSKLLTRKLML